MFNPLLTDLSNLKNEDLENKINELMRKYTIAARNGQGGICNQILVVLEAHKEEQRKRYQAVNQKLVNQNKNLEEYINIDR